MIYILIRYRFVYLNTLIMSAILCTVKEDMFKISNRTPCSANKKKQNQSTFSSTQPTHF